MKTIIVGFSTHKGAFSWLIRTATSSSISHTYIRLPVCEYNTSMIFQASGLLVNYCSDDVFSKKNQVIEEYDITLSDEQAAIGEEFRIRESGKPYAIKQIFGFIYVLGMRKFNKKVANPFSDGKQSYVCVETNSICIGLVNGESMTPEDLRRWCQKNGKLIIR